MFSFTDSNKFKSIFYKHKEEDCKHILAWDFANNKEISCTVKKDSNSTLYSISITIFKHTFSLSGFTFDQTFNSVYYFLCSIKKLKGLLEHYVSMSKLQERNCTLVPIIQIVRSRVAISIVERYEEAKVGLFGYAVHLGIPFPAPRNIKVNINSYSNINHYDGYDKGFNILTLSDNTQELIYRILLGESKLSELFHIIPSNQIIDIFSLQSIKFHGYEYIAYPGIVQNPADIYFYNITLDAKVLNNSLEYNSLLTKFSIIR